MKKLLLNTALIMGLGTSAWAGGGGDILRASVVADELEYQFSNEKAVNWNTYGYIGYDLNKIYIYSEGEKNKDKVSDTENQLVYSRAIAPFWDVQLGVGYDKTEESDQSWAVLGLQGLAPYFFETRVAFLVGDDGNIGVRAEAEYEALLTQKLILTPSVGLSAYSRDNEKMGIGSGFSNLTLGTRLRYEIKREFAPYIGVEWSKNFGNTDDFAPLDEVYAVAGVRVWF